MGYIIQRLVHICLCVGCMFNTSERYLLGNRVIKVSIRISKPVTVDEFNYNKLQTQKAIVCEIGESFAFQNWNKAATSGSGNKYKAAHIHLEISQKRHLV